VLPAVRLVSPATLPPDLKTPAICPARTGSLLSAMTISTVSLTSLAARVATSSDVIVTSAPRPIRPGASLTSTSGRPAQRNVSARSRPST
jgi:hypothetical protein